MSCPQGGFAISVAGLVESYGYLAVFIGTFLEGETVLLAAGFAAHQGLLDWRLVAPVAFAGATLGDQVAFLLGRWKGEALLARYPALARHAPQVHRLLERFDVVLILMVRFLYGMRIAGPVIMGSSRIPLFRFSLLNMIGAAAWAAIISGAGYAFGAAMEALLSHLEHIEEMLLLSILGVGFMLWLRHLVNRR